MEYQVLFALKKKNIFSECPLLQILDVALGLAICISCFPFHNHNYHKIL